MMYPLHKWQCGHNSCSISIIGILLWGKPINHNQLYYTLYLGLFQFLALRSSSLSIFLQNWGVYLASQWVAMWPQYFWCNVSWHWCHNWHPALRKKQLIITYCIIQFRLMSVSIFSSPLFFIEYYFSQNWGVYLASQWVAMWSQYFENYWSMDSSMTPTHLCQLHVEW